MTKIRIEREMNMFLDGGARSLKVCKTNQTSRKSVRIWLACFRFKVKRKPLQLLFMIAFLLLTSFIYREGIFGGFLRKEQRFRFRIRHLVKSQAFYWIVIICVFLNTIVLAIEHHGQDAFLEKFEGNERHIVRPFLMRTDFR